MTPLLNPVQAANDPSPVTRVPVTRPVPAAHPARGAGGGAHRHGWAIRARPA
jgi:hypothetical protein